MKRLALVVVFLAAFASGALANGGSINLFLPFDGVGTHLCSGTLSGFDTLAVGVYYSTNDGPEMGRAAEFRIQLSTVDALITTVQWSPSIVVSLGDVTNGISITGSVCLGIGQTFVFLGTLTIQDLGENGRFTATVLPDPNQVPPVPSVSILLCDANNTVAYVTGGTFVVNGTCDVGVEKKTWGAIKQLYH